jgi:hypothetical protein
MILTYDKFLELGIDSVAFEKENGFYSIDFRKVSDESEEDE